MRLIVVLGAMLLVGACGTSDAGDPPGAGPSTTSAAPATTEPPPPPPAPAAVAVAVEKLMRALDEGDCRTAKKLVVTPSELGCDVVELSKGSFADEGIDLDAVTYRAGKVHDDSSTVTITWDNDYPPESYDVQRIAGRWKVIFDSAA